MSDKAKAKRIAGLTLVLAALLTCLIPALCVRPAASVRYRSGLRTGSGIRPIVSESNGEVPVNLADAEELTSLPGIGETLSALIVAQREANGPFYYAEDLEAVKGIGPATLKRFINKINLTQGESGE